MVFVSTHAMLLDSTGRVFMMRRTDRCRDEHGRWDIISGGLDEGVTAWVNICREIAEETTAKVSRLEFLGYRDVFRGPESSPHAHTVGLDFMARISAHDAPTVRIRETEKFDDWGWFRAGDLPDPLHSQIPGLLARYPDCWR